MTTKSGDKPQRLRVVRARRASPKTYVEKCRALQEKILRERKGELMPDSTEEIRAMREGRSR